MIGTGDVLRIPNTDLEILDPTQTGKGFKNKICNICHVLKPMSEFEPNQRDARGNVTTRPSCRICRRAIDRRALSRKDKQEAEKSRPAKGTLFKCPICRKRSIAGVTAKIVLDHNKGIGQPRALICDSCNTGLGRFQNGENLLQNALLYVQEHGV
ncbi:MAG: endonuclease [Acidimicrobiia bacterium]|nr:endonuclease [Acidimicrobiia bacterium]